MAEFSQLLTTKKGQTLIAKMLSVPGGIIFTRIATTSTAYELDQLEDLTNLVGIEQDVTISKVSRPTETTAKVEGAIQNGSLVTGYYIRTIGLYATDPDEGEILFAVTIETSGNCYMPAYNGVAVSGVYVKLIARVSNSEIVSLVVDPAAVATVGDIINKLDSDGGNISETVIESLDTIETEFPEPEAGEKSKTFLGKVKKFISDFNDFKAGIITLGKLVNNGQTTEPGFALDARYGKTLYDLYAQLNANLNNILSKQIAITSIKNDAGESTNAITVNASNTKITTCGNVATVVLNVTAVTAIPSGSLFRIDFANLGIKESNGCDYSGSDAFGLSSVFDGYANIRMFSMANSNIPAGRSFALRSTHIKQI